MSSRVTGASPVNPEVDPRARRVTRLVVVTVFLDLLGYGIIIPLLPFYVQSMGGSATSVGALLSCFALAQLMATPLLGRISDRVGRRRVMLLSLAGNAISMVLFALATHVAWLPLLFASRLLAGATAGNLSACQAAIADVASGAARAKGMGRVGAGIGLGLIFGPVFGAWLSELGAWAPPLGAAIMALADLGAAYIWMPETRDPAHLHASAEREGFSAALRAVANGPFVIVLGLYFLVFLCMSTLQVALALLTKARLDWSEVEVGHVFGLFGVVMFVVQGLLPGWLARTFGERQVVTVGTLLVGSGLVGIALAFKPGAMIGALVLMALGLGFTQPFLPTLASEQVAKKHYGSALGLAQSAGGLARVIGPSASGVLYERLSPAAPFYGGACAALLALLLSLALRLTSTPDRS